MVKGEIATHFKEIESFYELRDEWDMRGVDNLVVVIRWPHQSH